ncbi:MAG: Isopentenyl-diphosphate Delta-isomerase [Microgenomates group bacterium GW2011_GWA2_40_6]|nr:MAG: Isopentenyl-diphosphate Delta-isomerase [Microgenomates group bacterium GW2011_GWA2_40_6]
MDELLDLVNEKDEVIGEVWKSEAHRNPKLIHREILILIFDKNNRLLMQQRSFNKIKYPGYWTESCAGHVLKGEEPETAAHRELKEELGFDVLLKFVEKRLVDRIYERYFKYYFVGRYAGELIMIDRDEVEDTKFFTLNKFDNLYRNETEKVLVQHISEIRAIWLVNK